MSSHRSTRRRRARAQRKHRVHAAPGTLVSVPDAPPARITAFTYGPDGCDEHELARPEDLAGLLGKRAVTWIDVTGVGHADSVAGLGKVLRLHRLALEDVVNTHQRPKVEEYGETWYVVTRMLVLGEGLESEQVSLFVGAGWLVSFQERPGDCFDGVRQRIREGRGIVRDGGADYLAYALLDAVIDGFFPVLEKLGDRLETLEDEVLTAASESTMASIQSVKRDLLAVRRVAWPQREALSALLRAESSFVGPETRTHLRDCHDHCVQVIDLLETHRELAAGLMDMYLSMVSNRMNEIMKVLTIMATIFIPLSFIAGLYGMNFVGSPWNMPELHWRYGYLFALGLMGATAGALLWFFRRRGWLGKRDPLPPPPPDGSSGPSDGDPSAPGPPAS